MTGIGSTGTLSVMLRRVQGFRALRSAAAQKPPSTWFLKRRRAAAKSKSLALISAIAIGTLVSGCGTSSTHNSTAASGAKETPLFRLLPKSTQTSKSIVLATNAEYPTCQYYAVPGGPMVGYEVDLWNAIAEQLGVQLKVINTAFNGLLPGVQAGRYNTAMECLDDTPQREKVVSFVDFEYDTAALYTLRTTAAAGKITSNPLSVCGKVTGEVTGESIAQNVEVVFDRQCAKHGLPKVILSEYPDQGSELTALYAGRIAFVMDDAAAASYVLQHAPVHLAELHEASWPKTYVGAIFNPSESQLAKAWLAAANAIVRDGSYGRIMQKWKVSSLALDHPGIDLCGRSAFCVRTDGNAG